jgi:hypothetical protein
VGSRSPEEGDGIMGKRIKIDGVVCEVVNAYSSGPGAPAFEYDLRDGGYVYCVGPEWKLQMRGQFARVVNVEIIAE